MTLFFSRTALYTPGHTMPKPDHATHNEHRRARYDANPSTRAAALRRAAHRYEKNREAILAKKKTRYSTDPAYRQACIEDSRRRRAQRVRTKTP